MSSDVIYRNKKMFGSDEDQSKQFNSVNFYNKQNITYDVSLLIEQYLSNETYSFDGVKESVKMLLSNWQLSQLDNVKESKLGVKCLLNSWLIKPTDLKEGAFCNATWDNVYCWPATPIGTKVSRTCQDAFQDTEPLYAPHLSGHGYRECLANGLWLWDGWTNYTECADSLDEFVEKTTNLAEDNATVTTIQYILFIGSLLSLVFILTALITFCSFRTLWCDRVKIHVHLMTALMLRYIMLLIITEPHIFHRSSNYRSHDGFCKGLLIAYLFSTLCSVNWMFIQGIYINGRLTTNVFDDTAPFKLYHTIGWLFPTGLMVTWATIMGFNNDAHCWSGYSAMNEIWIIVIPIMIALLINFMFLINILRVLLTKVRTPIRSDAMQFRRAAKATLLLFPLLGINNLLVLYNPGGSLQKYFAITNTFFSSAQGVFVAIGYCYLSSDVRAAFRGVYRRFLAQRNINNSSPCENPQNQPNENSTFRSDGNLEQPGISV